MTYKPPKFEETSFNCLYCDALSRHYWHDVFYQNERGSFHKHTDLKIEFCEHCKEITVWRLGNLVFPDNGNVQKPNKDLPDDIKEDYLEAASILQKSPRGSAALLRLAIQKLCKHLGEKGKNINTDIASLVKKGLPVKVQQALDYVRVIGNNSVHPGKIDMKDDIESATNLFQLINIISEVMITQPKEISDLYESLPKTKKEAIEKRDEN